MAVHIAINQVKWLADSVKLASHVHACLQEHLVFGGAKHISLRSLPGMKERSIRLGSAGKTFSFTAWKVGGGCVCVCVADLGA